MDGKKEMREVAASFGGRFDERSWAAFLELRVVAGRLRAAGIAIHPTFHRWNDVEPVEPVGK